LYIIIDSGSIGLYVCDNTSQILEF